jgi:hypothetical protein
MPLFNSLCGPRSHHMRDRSIEGKRQAIVNSLSQLKPPLLTQRHEISRCGTLAAKEWRPKVIKVLEIRRNINWVNLHVGKTGMLK